MAILYKYKPHPLLRFLLIQDVTINMKTTFKTVLISVNQDHTE